MSEHLQVIAPAGVIIREQPMRSSARMGALERGTVIEVNPGQREADLFIWRELISGGWVAQQGGEDNVTILAPAPAPVPVETGSQPGVAPAPTPVFVPARPLILGGRGVHASAGGWAPTEDEANRCRRNGVESVLIAAYVDGQASLAVSRFRDAGVRDFIIRAATGRNDAITPNPDDFVNETLPRLQEYQNALGTSLVVALHNEPNISVEGLGRAWQDGTGFSRWFLGVARRYREALPGVRIGFPALSPGIGVSQENFQRMEEFEFAAQCTQAIEASDWVGVHAYFVGDGTDIDLKPTRWRQMARGRSIIITEGGPADMTFNSSDKLRNIYSRCGEAGFPVMAWLLSGAGAWEKADWMKQSVEL